MLAVAALAAGPSVAAPDKRAGPSTQSSVRAYTIHVTSSRGYKFDLIVRLNLPPVVLRKPGFNVGETDVVVHPNFVSLSIRNRTPGRVLGVMGDSNVIAVRVFWKLPRILYTRGGDSHSYVRAMSQFGGTEIAIPVRGSVTLRLAPTFANPGYGFDGVKAKDVGWVIRTFRARPAYVQVLSDSNTVLMGYWDGCPNESVIAAVTGSGRRLPLSEDVCRLLHFSR